MKTLTILALLAMATVCIAADYTAEIVSPRQLVGPGYEPTAWTDYHVSCGPGWSGEDVTGQYGLTDPNLMVTKIVCDNATIAAMETAGYIILWAERVPDMEVPK